MKLTSLLGVFTALCVGGNALRAQEPDSNKRDQVKALQQQLLLMQQEFANQQRLFQLRLEALQKQIHALEIPPAKPVDEQKHLRDMMQTKLSEPLAGDPPAKHDWRPTDLIRLAGDDERFLNLSLGALMAMGTTTASDIAALSPGGHDPNQRGFSVQNLELTMDGRVGPHLSGHAFFVFPIGRDGATRVEVEEAFMETDWLPLDMTLRAGHIFSEFGRHNPTHPHTWEFVDMPLINHRMFGGDGLRQTGVRLFAPIHLPFHSEFVLTLMNGQGETAHSFRSDHGGAASFGRAHRGLRNAGALAFRDMIVNPRYQIETHLTESQTLLAGVSAAFGANASGADTGSQIYGADLTWTWSHEPHEKGVPYVTWQSETMYRRYQAGAYTDDLNADGVPDLNLAGDGVTVLTVPRETIEDYGFYTQLIYGFHPDWRTGLRWDYVAPNRAQYEGIIGLDADRNRRWRISPNLTWQSTEFARVRLQYNYDSRERRGIDHSVWLQFDLELGAHEGHDAHRHDH